jgi:hypothetical protein
MAEVIITKLSDVAFIKPLRFVTIGVTLPRRITFAPMLGLVLMPSSSKTTTRYLPM